MADLITIQSIHPETRTMVVVLSIEGQTYPKVLPFFNIEDSVALTAQLQAFAQELRGEFDTLIAATQAADAGTIPPASAAVTALVGTAIPVDTAAATPPAS